MRRPAERRAQATIELLALLAVAAALVAIAAIAFPSIAPTVARALAGDAPPPLPVDADDALQGRGLSVAATRALLGDAAVEEAARRRTAAALRRSLRMAPPMGLARSGALRAMAMDAAPRIRIVTAADEERYRRRGTTAAERAEAAGASIAWDGAEILARRLARPLGVAVGAIHVAVDDDGPPDPLPPGTRADDVVACQPVRLVTANPAVRPTTTAWHIVIVRAGRIVVDALSADDRACDA